MQIFRLKVVDELEKFFTTKEKALFFAVSSIYNDFIKDMKDSNAYDDCDSLEMEVKGYDDKDGKHYTKVNYYPAIREQRQSRFPYAEVFISEVTVEE